MKRFFYVLQEIFTMSVEAELEESVNFEDIRVVPATGTTCRNSTFLDEGLGVWRCPSFGRALFGATVECCTIRGLKGLG